MIRRVMVLLNVLIFTSLSIDSIVEDFQAAERNQTYHFYELSVFFVSLVMMVSSYSKKFNTVRYLYGSFCTFILGYLFYSIKVILLTKRERVLLVSSYNI